MISFENLAESIRTVLPGFNTPGVVRSILMLIFGLPLIFMISKWVRAYVAKNFSAQQGMIIGKGLQYSGLALIALSLFHELGFKLGPLLGAAGILGIALGFASQTSVSNIISGIFLIAEKPFVVGDAITVGSTTGQVLSIDFLSVKLRTFDNKFVRIPNETLIKSEVTNITHFPIRRVDITVSVAYKEDLKRVRQILIDVANQNPLALQEPEPLLLFNAFNSSSIDFLFAVWAAQPEWLKLKNSLPEDIKTRFEQEGIEIPFPHLSIYTGSATDPLPIKSIV
jgi:small-conductance mechanosensitive channel